MPEFSSGSIRAIPKSQNGNSSCSRISPQTFLALLIGASAANAANSSSNAGIVSNRWFYNRSGPRISSVLRLVPRYCQWFQARRRFQARFGLQFAVRWLSRSSAASWSGDAVRLLQPVLLGEVWRSAQLRLKKSFFPRPLASIQASRFHDPFRSLRLSLGNVHRLGSFVLTNSRWANWPVCKLIGSNTASCHIGDLRGDHGSLVFG
jgi:hypothetical protein